MLFPKQVLYTCDPSLTCSGWAVFCNGELTHHGYVRTTAKETLPARVERAAKEMWKDCHLDPTHVAIEYPKIYQRKTSTDDNDLLPVASVAGAVMFLLNDLVADFTVYCPPSQWKGSIKKEIMNARILSKLDEREMESFEAKNYAKSYAHNVVDAIGIGLYYLGRLG